MKTRAEKARVLRIQKFYTIKGDGVAQLNLENAATNIRFKNAVKRISNLEIEKTIDTPNIEHNFAG